MGMKLKGMNICTVFVGVKQGEIATWRNGSTVALA